MQMDLGTEIVAMVVGIRPNSPEPGYNFGDRVGEILEKHFPDGTLICVQVIEARTVRELTKKS